MFKHIVKRILQAIPLMLIISIITFTLIQLAPYDAIDSMIEPGMSIETIEALKKEAGVDKPVYIQYINWLKNVLKGDFGNSIVTKANIAESLSVRIPNTIILILPAYILSLILGVIFGLLTASKRGGILDKIVEFTTSIAISSPNFWIGILFIFLFSYKFKLFPSFGMHSPNMEGDYIDLLRHMVLPCLTLTIAFFPAMIRYVRSSAIGQLSEDYVTVQKAYGSTKSQILRRHVLKNSLLPLITLVGMQLPMLVTGAVITETVFSWPGVGPYFITAINGLDYPIIMTILILSSSLVIIGNLLADTIYSLIDTRIKDMK